MWYHQAKCKDYPKNLWFGGGPPQREEAIRICNQCEVKEECLEDALATPTHLDLGIRGGLTKRARLELRKKRKKES